MQDTPLRQVPTRQQVVIERLKQYILVQELRAGDRLPTEGELAHQLGVSRSAIREALRALEALGIITAKQGSGRYVNRFSFQPILDNLGYSILFDLHTFEELLEVRQKLEVGFLEEAIQHLSPEILEKLHEITIAMEKSAEAGDTDTAFLDQDMKFHMTLFSPLHNALLLKLLEVFWAVQKRLRMKMPQYVEERLHVVNQHRAIIEALEEQNVALARARLEAHFAGVRAWLAQGKTSQSRQSLSSGLNVDSPDV